jgi:membrane protein
MPLRDNLQKAAKVLDRQARHYGRAGESLYKTLVADRRWFAATSAAVTDYWQKKLYYFNGNFTYNAFLAVIALLVALSSLIGIMAQANKNFSDNIVKFLKSTVPLFGSAPQSTLNAMKTYRSVVGVLGFLALLWTGTKISHAVDWGFSQIWGTKSRSYIKGKVFGLFFISIVGLLFLGAFLVQFGFEAAWKWIAGSHHVVYNGVIAVVKPLLGLMVNFGLFFFLFAVVPRVKQLYRKVAVAAVVSAALFLAMQYLIGFYFRSISNVPSVYGSISTAIILIVWLHGMGLITFFGGELSYVLQHDELVEEHRIKASSWSLFGELGKPARVSNEKDSEAGTD